MNKTLAILIGVVAVLGATTMLLLGGSSSAADITFIGRGVVKPGGDSNSINVYWTQVPAAVERIRGVRTDVSTGGATKYVWEVNSSGSLVKTKTSSMPTPEKEVVIRGSLHDDDRVTASWVVTNYRQFKIEGRVEGVSVDTGTIDEGWVTVNVTSSIFRDVTPTRKFKETVVKGNDVRIRVNGLTTVTSLGRTKSLDQVSASEQNVTVEGEVQNEDSWVASKFNEVN
jgi:hypothetical protein